MTKFNQPQTATDKEPEPLHLTYSLNGALETITRVEQLLLERGCPCRTSSALGSLFAKVKRLNNQAKPVREDQWRVTFLKANDAVRIAHAIEAALEDPKSKESIHRVTTSDMTLDTRQKSQGKDALWELDLYRRFKLGQTPVRFEEPDLVVSLGDELGDYAIACKKSYSERSVADSLSEGCSQLLKHGRPGIVAFNLDDLVPEDSIWEETTREALQMRLNEMNRTFLTSNAEHFTKAVERGSCDGILVSTTVISDVPEMSPRIQVSRSTAIWDYKASSDAKIRFAALRDCLDGVLHQRQEDN